MKPKKMEVNFVDGVSAVHFYMCWMSPQVVPFHPQFPK
jgi:hypothetical protein